MIDRYVPARFSSRIKRWVKSHGMLSVCLAALLPPPIPLLPFLLAAGALGVSWKQLFVALGIARTLRYGGEAALAMVYGRQILRWFDRYLAGSASLILYSFLALLAAAIAFGIWKYRHDQHQQPARERPAHAAD